MNLLQDKKFIPGQNTLSASSSSYVIAGHSQKTTMNVWKWDKKEPYLRFPLKEQLTVAKLSHNNSSLLIGGTKSGRLSVWQVVNGQLIGEVESAHYMDITDLDISSSNDLVITAGKDCKVKVWIMAELFNYTGNDSEYKCLTEFGEHTAEVTAVQFSRSNSQRCFSASLDKLFKVYDIPSKLTLKTISA